MKHSVCRWCYPEFSLDELCEAAAGLGIASVELLDLDELPALQKHGLACGLLNEPAIVDDHGRPLTAIEHGWNDPANHARLRRLRSQATCHGALCSSCGITVQVILGASPPLTFDFESRIKRRICGIWGRASSVARNCQDHRNQATTEDHLS